MQRLLCYVRVKLISSSFWELAAPEIGRKNDGGIVKAWRSFGTSTGYLGKEPNDRPMQREIVNALTLGERNRASSLLSELVGGSQALQARDFIYILQYCARTPDPLFVMETWKLMEEREITMNATCYFLTIRALCKGGYLKEAFNIVAILGENSDVAPTLPMYNNLLQSCVTLHSLNYANECLQLMEHQSVGKSEITYALLLKLAVLQKDLSAVHEIWKEWLKSYSLSIITLRKFIRSFTVLKDLESAYVALQQMVDVAFQHRSFGLAKTAEGKFHHLKLDIPIPCQDKFSWNNYVKNNYIPINSLSKCNNEEGPTKSQDKIKFSMGAVQDSASGLRLSDKPFSVPVMKFLRWSFNDVIHTSVRERKFLLAEQLVVQMQTLGLEPSSCSYDGYVRALVSMKGFDDGVEVLKVMQQKNMKPHDSTLAAISVSCSRSLEVDLAENFLDQISHCPYAYPYNALLEACDTLDHLERAVRVFSKMKYSNVRPNIRTYELLFKLFGNVNAPYEDGNISSQVDVAKRINAIEKDMMKHGIQHSYVSMQNILRAFGMEGMVKELIQYLHAAEKQFSSRKSYTMSSVYDIVLHSLVEAKETHMAIEIFRSMISCGFPPSENTYSIMIDCCSITKCYRSASALVSRMIRSGFCLHRVTYSALVKVLLKFDEFHESLKLLELARLEGTRLDALSYNTILGVAKEKGRIDVIELIVEHMHREKIWPDPATCSHVFYAYLNNGFDATAMEALQVLSMRMISGKQGILEETRLEYEHLIFNENVEAESKIIEVFKRSTNLAVALLHLRWCATLGFPISWLPNESPWAKRLSCDYASRRAG